MLIDYDSTFNKIQELYKNSSGEVHKAYSKCLDVISEMPEVDAKPVKHGKWIEEDDGETDYLFCSECKKEAFF
ncbi:MAG: hypothetical protein J6S85_13995 [Methanobrevibacter sp.]|nr:hypothetical protein [Methanobrevibacter sp.]